MELRDNARRSVDLLLRIVPVTVMTTFCYTLLATLLRYWLLLPMLIFYITHSAFYHCYVRPKYKDIIDDRAKGRVTVGRLEMDEEEVVGALFCKIFLAIGVLLLIGMTIAASAAAASMKIGVTFFVTL